VCAFCEAPLTENDERETRAIATFTVSGGEAQARPELEAASAAEEEPEWRREIARRLAAYRARQHRLRPDDSQTALPFLETGESASEAAYARGPVRVTARIRPPQRVVISAQPELDFAAAAESSGHPRVGLVPVAGLDERRRAGLLDAAFVLLSYVGFLGLFRSMGGHLSFDKVDAAVYAAAFFLLYSFYFSLFTVLGGATPGMLLRGLSAVRLDGSRPEARQFVWRSFGYLLSGGTLLLGFLWSLWDEDHLTWHDRISQTYLTACGPLTEGEPLEAGPGRQTFAHK
jgi:uncharacterized RDD family membrane protein YckC